MYSDLAKYRLWTELAAELGEFGRRNATVTLTNGCFDPLHHGHICMLREASNCGDILVVAVNSDESVKAIKGPTRPRFSYKVKKNGYHGGVTLQEMVIPIVVLTPTAFLSGRSIALGVMDV